MKSNSILNSFSNLSESKRYLLLQLFQNFKSHDAKYLLSQFWNRQWESMHRREMSNKDLDRFIQKHYKYAFSHHDVFTDTKSEFPQKTCREQKKSKN